MSTLPDLRGGVVDYRSAQGSEQCPHLVQAHAGILAALDHRDPHDVLPSDILDVIVIGAGPAGLQAAMTLARIHRSVVVLDSGRYRNDGATHMHNFAAHDGQSPAEYRAAARADLAAYDTVRTCAAAATDVVRHGDAFDVTIDSGDRLGARAVVLATGVRDVLPEVPGLAPLWGTVGFGCPFCHGHELSGRTVMVQGGPGAPHVSRLMSGIAGRLVVPTDGHQFTDDELADLASLGAEVIDARVVSLAGDESGATVALDDGSSVVVDGFLVRSRFEQAAPFPEQLGLTLLSSGCIEVDVFGRTSLPGVYAAGDLAHSAALPMPMASVLQAAAAGQLAASVAIMDLMASDRVAPEPVVGDGAGGDAVDAQRRASWGPGGEFAFRPPPPVCLLLG